MTTREVLQKARALVATPDKWQKCGGVGPNGERCAAVAIYDAAHRLYSVEVQAEDALIASLGLHSPDQLYEWNDADERTHADVLAAFDRAIEAQA